MPPKKKNQNPMEANTQFKNVPDEQIFIFHKDEIVWAKMKFFSAWPAKVCYFSFYQYLTP